MTYPSGPLANSFPWQQVGKFQRRTSEMTEQDFLNKHTGDGDVTAKRRKSRTWQSEDALYTVANANICFNISFVLKDVNQFQVFF